MDNLTNPTTNGSADNKFSLGIAICILRAISVLPLPLLYFLGVFFGEAAFWLVSSRRKVTIKNLTACFPDKTPVEIRKLARKHFHHLVTGVFTMTVAWWASPKRLKRLLVSNGSKKLKTLLEQNQNVIVLAPHFTSLEFLGGSLFSEFHMTSMYQNHKKPSVDRFIRSRRRRFGSELFNYKGSMTPLIKSIRKGVPFYYLPDQDPGKTRGVFAPFYKIPTATFPALSKIARLGNARVIPCMAKLLPYGRGFEIIFDEPLKNYPGENEIKDAAIMNRAIEKLIEYAPEQYFWSHRRFKTRPDGDPPFYQ
jgi:KDO2-lipid IV(A) lauroyltransferase